MAAESGFRGVYPMLYAFFERGGRLDRGAMRAQVEHCVAEGAHGIAALGLGTEVSKLTPEERRAVVTWVAEDLAGRLPLAITVFGATPAEQIAFVRAAAEHGADWVILQPPQTGRARSPRTSWSTSSARSPTPRPCRSRSRTRRSTSASA